MDNNIGKLLYFSGAALIILGVILALIIGFRFYLIPPDVGAATGIVFDEGMLHPQRWWMALGSFMSTTVFGLILIGIAGVIQAIEVGKIEAKELEEKPKQYYNP